MSLNWVMLDESSKTFICLPRERILLTSPARTSLTLQTPNSYPGKEPLSIKSPDGKAYITTQRLVYLPSNPTTQFQSLSVPILSLQDTRVTAPFFGPNLWEGILLPTPGGGFSAQHYVVQIKLTFREGGAFDFQSTFEQIKEQMAHAAEIARESGQGNRSGAAPIEADLEQLPAYEEAGPTNGVPEPVTSCAQESTPQIQRPTPIAPNGATRPIPPGNAADERAPRAPSTSSEPVPRPDEAPPSYEEAQARSVAGKLESDLREQ